MPFITRERIVRGGRVQVPVLLAECIVPHRAAESGGARTETQKEGHALMCHYLSMAIDEGVYVGSKLCAMQKREGQSSMIAQFAYAHAMGFAGGISEIWVRDAGTRRQVRADIKAYVALKAAVYGDLELVEADEGLMVCMSALLRSCIKVTVANPLPVMEELLPTIDMHLVDASDGALFMFSGTPLTHSRIQFPSEDEMQKVEEDLARSV